MTEVKDIQFTLNEYLKLEETSNVKHEFYFGKLFEMPGAAVLHNNICLKIFLALFNQLNKAGYQVNVENVKVQIDNEDIYLYPDVLVTREQLKTMKEYIVHQPLFLAEVLSDSTRKYDSTDKFMQYQKITSLRYYLLVEPEKYVIIFYEKDDAGEWSSKVFTGLEEVIALPFFDAEIVLGDIYE